MVSVELCLFFLKKDLKKKTLYLLVLQDWYFPTWLWNSWLNDVDTPACIWYIYQAHLVLLGKYITCKSTRPFASHAIICSRLSWRHGIHDEAYRKFKNFTNIINHCLFETSLCSTGTDCNQIFDSGLELAPSWQNFLHFLVGTHMRKRQFV